MNNSELQEAIDQTVSRIEKSSDPQIKGQMTFHLSQLLLIQRKRADETSVKP